MRESVSRRVLLRFVRSDRSLLRFTGFSQDFSTVTTSHQDELKFPMNQGRLRRASPLREGGTAALMGLLMSTRWFRVSSGDIPEFPRWFCGFVFLIPQTFFPSSWFRPGHRCKLSSLSSSFNIPLYRFKRKNFLRNYLSSIVGKVYWIDWNDMSTAQGRQVRIHYHVLSFRRNLVRSWMVEMKSGYV